MLAMEGHSWLLKKRNYESFNKRRMQFELWLCLSFCYSFPLGPIYGSTDLAKAGERKEGREEGKLAPPPPLLLLLLSSSAKWIQEKKEAGLEMLCRLTGSASGRRRKINPWTNYPFHRQIIDTTVQCKVPIYAEINPTNSKLCPLRAQR